MKNFTNFNQHLRVVTMLLFFVLISACNLSSDSPIKEQDTSSKLDGTYEYLPPLKGQSILIDGRYVYLYGQDTLMTGEAGTYQISGDTVTNYVTYSTNKELIGATYMWAVESMKKDTVSYIIMDENGVITGRAKSIKR